MPIRDMLGKPVLVCVNQHKMEEVMESFRRMPEAPGAKPSLTTMVVVPTWMTIPATFQVADGSLRPDVDHGVPVQVYLCRVCGYVEMYAQPFTQWAPPGGRPGV